MKLLALDLSSNIGWAYSHDEYGLHKLIKKKNMAPAIRFLQLRNWLETNWKYVDGIVYEEVHMRGLGATKFLIGLVTEVEAFAAKYRIMLLDPVHTGTLKKWATGYGKATKEEMVCAANAYGCKTDNDNVADAYLLLKYCQERG